MSHEELQQAGHTDGWVGGIPESVFHGGHSMGDYGTFEVTGMDGKHVYVCKIGGDFLSIKRADGTFSFWAAIDLERLVQMGIKTRERNDSGEIVATDPNLYAGLLVEKSLQHFYDCGNRVMGVKGKWSKTDGWNDNRSGFEHMIEDASKIEVLRSAGPRFISELGACSIEERRARLMELAAIGRLGMTEEEINELVGKKENRVWTAEITYKLGFGLRTVLLKDCMIEAVYRYEGPGKSWQPKLIEQRA